MTVRLPSAAGYAASVEKEQRFLPFLAPHLPLPVPVPLAKGVPGEGYPFHWSINRWLHGETARPDRINDLSEFAASLAAFLTALQGVDASGGPPAGAHSFHRGGSLTAYDDETRRSIEDARGPDRRGQGPGGVGGRALDDLVSATRSGSTVTWPRGTSWSRTVGWWP